ncbi:GerMN domain-containing protein [Bacillus sp. 03113]|uniref:GerMN domain-containing protein n=1 Tax=Bacillus sp. 03113 TaxID=2578211 RepID=UPI0011431404|nr:GerMN domain-containing protein [Bacillus sp. 03113]
MFKNKKATLVSAILSLVLILSGCGLLGGGKKQEIDPPKEETYSDGDQTTTAEQAETKKDKASEEQVSSIPTELYLLDKNGYIVPQTLNLPKTNSVAKQALEYLVQNGPITEMLPNGFKAVLPVDTKLSVSIKDKTATVDFSKEFSNYKPEEEMKILQAVTWTLTQFDSVEKVKLQMNGHELTKMPVNGTPIEGTLSRKNGINIDTADVVDITNTKAITVYYIGGEEGSNYYVPITKRVSSEENNNIKATVAELVSGPVHSSHLLTEFLPDVKLLDDPKIDNGVVTLNFNEAIYGGLKENMISKQLLDSLVLSLTEQSGIKEVAVKVNGKSELVNEKGDKLSEPVTRPENVNTGSF